MSAPVETIAPANEPPAPTLPAAGSSFYLGMRVLPPEKREAMYAVYAFCRAVDDIADDGGPSPERQRGLDLWRADLEALYQGEVRPRTAGLAPYVKQFGLRLSDFLDVVAGMEMDVLADIQAPSRAELDLSCDRVASAVGRLSGRIFGLAEGPADRLAHHLGRALQLTNILRDLDDDAAINRLYLPREALERAGMTDFTPEAVLAHPGLDEVARDLADAALRHYDGADQVMRSVPAALVKAPRLMEAAYKSVLKRLMKRGFRPPRARVRTSKIVLIGALLRYGLR